MTQEEFHKRYHYSPTKDCLGEGGFGKVFKAYDNHLDKWVAIKMVEVRPGLEHGRLKHEVEIVNKLPTHQNIARYEECYTFSSFSGEYDFAVLQYYESGNLQQLLETKQLTEQQKDSILQQILAGIEFLHNQGIIHRDLKPQNILIVNRNGEYIPKITDFGISKKLDANKSSVFTNSLAGVGTLAYASPEQLRGLTIKKNTDLWSFGVIVCYVFLSRLPFKLNGESITNEDGRQELYKQIANGKLDSSVSQLSINWLSLVRKCIIVNIEDRVESVAACFDILGEKEYYWKEVKPTINTLGEVLTVLNGFFFDFKYDYLGSFIDGLAIVKRNGLSGFINKFGIEVIPCQFESVDIFHDGLACVKRNGKYGFIDKKGKVIISCEHTYSGYFSDDFCPIYPSITSNNPDYILDKVGRKFFVKDKFDGFSHFHDGLAQVSVTQSKFLKKCKNMDM
ncbi:MAG: protein kinase [Bacteroidales bacterium]|nr:protein kinase [Bacteroidales bacterium]